MRIIFVPQFPSKMRYQSWWFTEFPIQFRQRGFEVLTLGEKYIKNIKSRRSALNMFSLISKAIEFETEQIKEYIELDIKEDDILFVSDISFPGFFCNVLYHKKSPKMFAFCHATSINKFDYFEDVKNSKFQVETAHSELFNKVFIGSKYHQEKLKWKNTMVTYLPFQPVDYKISNVKKKIAIMSASRPSKQKVDSDLELSIESKFNLKIQRPDSNTWGSYHMSLHSAKMLLITSHEDTFGYQIVDAIMNNCIPVARNGLAYHELLPRPYLYDGEHELGIIIDHILNNNDDPVPVPKLLCEEQMNKFYEIICEEMKNG